jgi:hypothetical protein
LCFVIGSVTPVMSVSWKASLPMSVDETWPVMQTIGIESSIAVAIPVTRFVAPGPDVASATPTRPKRARSRRPCARALLVANEDVADRVLEHRVVRRHDRAAGVAEDDVDAFSRRGPPR